MCNSTGGASAPRAAGTPATAAAVVPAPAAQAPAATQAGGPSSCGGGAPTQFEPAGAALQAQLTDAMRQLQALGVQGGGAPSAPGQSPIQTSGPTGGGPGTMTRFQLAEQGTQRIALEPVTDGPSAIRNLQQVAAARTDRLARMEAAFQADSNVTGSMNPVDQQKLHLERSTLSQLGALIAKVTPLASTIDVNEGTALVKLANDVNASGSFNPAQLARAVIQIDGSASNLPASYMTAAMRAQDFAATIDARIDQASNALSASANATGSFDPAQLQQVSQMTSDRSKLSDALRRNFDLAKSSPADAQARLDRALQSTDLATVIASLG